MKLGPKGRLIAIYGFLAIFIVLSNLILAQLLYPKDRTLPLAKVGSRSIGNLPKDDAINILSHELINTKIELTTESGYSKTYSLSEVGAEPLIEDKVNELTNYLLSKRFMPFSILVKGTSDNGIKIKFVSDGVDKIIEQIAKDIDRPTVDAGLTISQDKVVIEEGRDGVKVPEKELKSLLADKRYEIGLTNQIEIPLQTTKPNLSKEKLVGLKLQAETVIDKNIQFSVSGRDTIKASPLDIASWLKPSTDKSLSLSIDRVALGAYLRANVEPLVLVPSTPTTIKMVDGKVTERVEGSSGIILNIDEAVSSVEKQLFEDRKSETIVVSTLAIAPSVKYDSGYTNSQAGVQAYFDAISSDGTIKLAFRQLTGDEWTASANASDSLPSASTYKLFIAYKLFNDIKLGRTSLDSPMLGTTVDDCLRIMITISTNQCAEEWLRQWGSRTDFNSFLYAGGFSQSTNFAHSVAVHTSARDLEKMLLGIYYQNLFESSASSKMLDLMKRQIHRKGVPSGTSAVVADKVGYLWDYYHDAAIVYHPRGTYVLVVMTKGKSWNKIADITRQVEAIIYP